MTTKRITQEFLKFQREPLEGCSANPVNQDDLHHWVATITGPSGSPYAGIVFTINVRYPDDYPHNALRIMFSTPIFHPNVSPQGDVQLAELERSQWSPAFTIQTVLVSLQAMLSDPNLEEGCVLNDSAARLYLEDLAGFEQKARGHVMAHAG
ncbi:UBC-like protein [Aureobasidium pullulans]|nr:UBC-like protein [Aureobasidium pullulans]